jgi:hypothetical protein
MVASDRVKSYQGKGTGCAAYRGVFFGILYSWNGQARLASWRGGVHMYLAIEFSWDSTSKRGAGLAHDSRLAFSPNPTNKLSPRATDDSSTKTPPTAHIHTLSISCISFLPTSSLPLQEATARALFAQEHCPWLLVVC